MYLGDAAVGSGAGVSDGVMAVILGSLERGRKTHCSGYIRVWRQKPAHSLGTAIALFNTSNCIKQSTLLWESRDMDLLLILILLLLLFGGGGGLYWGFGAGWGLGPIGLIVLVLVVVYLLYGYRGRRGPPL
jgi:hypothetical protein